MKRGDRIVAAARALVGVPFRLHGRVAESGLDCVGLVACALAAAGHRAAVPEGYGLRGGDPARFAGWLRAAGLRRVRTGKPGDVLLVQAGPAQFHLMLRVPGGFVHAHAGLRRVVEMPGAALWPVIGMWRWGR
ncbi:peptidoglycan endopeptidase [Sphingobium algorifonticola]|uniref:Peptidoglycan endopeptidase n=1 Tax=Sphingobium algorifonticola TaxID=2008318 RepID=A0A437JCT3_9SPHN|nr:peptidoglycan endopeptidase [Sphingobium algorifonticola]RVT43422.1 peptidoglycan endopeptidase [Sphingobium algorifonticola]